MHGNDPEVTACSVKLPMILYFPYVCIENTEQVTFKFKPDVRSSKSVRENPSFFTYFMAPHPLVKTSVSSVESNSLQDF